MDVTSSAMMAEYYEKLIDLQDKLRRSEEERLKLEIKFSEIIQVTREEKLRHQYKIFLEEDRRRQERNEKIVKSLEKIDARISRLTSKTELYQRPRRFCRNCHHRSCPIIKSPCVNDTQKSEPNFPKYGQDYQKESTDKLDVIDGYLSSLKTPVTSMKANKYEGISTNDLDNIREGLNRRFDSNKANSIATEIMNSIYSRHYDRDNSDPKKLDTSPPIPKLSEPFYEETETSQLNIQNASASEFYNKCNVRNIPDNEKSEKSARKLQDSENKPAVETKNIHEPTIESNHVRMPQNQAKNLELDALSSKRNGEENSFHEEDESKIVQELNCPTKENYTTDQDNTNIKDPRKNLTGQQFLKKMPDTEPSAVPIASQKSSLNVRSTEANPSKREDSQISKPKTEEEGGYVKLQEAPSTRINEVNRSEQSEEPLQQIQEDFQTKRSNDIPSVEDVDHLEYNRCEKKPTNQYETSPPIDQYAPQCDENEQAIQQQQVNTDGQHVDQYKTPYNQNGKVTQQQPLNGNGEHVGQYAHQQKEFDENGQRVDQVLQQHQQFDENGQHIDQYQPQYDENGQVLQQQPFDENGQHVDQYQPQYDENGQVLQQQPFDENGHHVDQYQPQYDENGQVLQQQQYDENGQVLQQYDDNGQPIGHAIQYDEHGQAIQYDENGQAIQYDENGQAIQYDENGQAIQYDENGQAIQYDENGQVIQYDENGQAIQYDENGQAIQYDENGQAIQYDENGQAIQYDENGQAIQYDQNGQAIQYDENGQAIQYDEHGQAIQYDEHGQPYPAYEGDPNLHYGQYNENGEPIQQYDEQYHENQQPIQEYGNYDQTDLQAGDGNGENIQENELMTSDARADLNQTGEKANTLEQAETSEVSLNPEAGGKVDVGQNNVLDMLDTDTDSVLQNTSKISNDSDFDFGSG